MGNCCCNTVKVTDTVTQQSQENKSFQPDDGIYIPAVPPTREETDLPGGNNNDDFTSSGYSNNKSFQPDDGIYIPSVSPTREETDLPGGNNNDDFKSSGYSTSHESPIPLPDYSDVLPDRRSQYKEPEENRRLSKEHQRIIKRKFRYLKDELDPEFLLDYFIQEELFTEDQAEEVRSAGRRRNQVDLFLRFLLRSRKSASYSQFLDILDQIKCGHIRTKLESKEDLDPIGFTSKGIESTRQQLQNHREEICSSIDSPSDIAEYFVQYEEFTIDEYELVIHESTRRLKAEKLLDTLLKDSHLQRGFDILNYALQDQGYSTIEYQDSEENCNSKKKRIPDSSGHFSKFQSVVDEERCFSHRFEEANEMRITIACTEQSKRKKEKKMVKKAKQYKVLSDLNDALICDAECLLTNVDQGSIVIRIKGCKKGAIESLFKSPNGIGVSKVLQKIFSHPKLAKIFDQSAIFHVTIDILPTPVKDITEKPKSLQQIICTNFDFLTEELDALRFLDLDIFTEKEKRDILQARPLSRSECTKLMLGYICEKNENDIDKFIHEIKQKKRFVWDHIFSPESKECLDDQILSTYYIEFVENLSPFKITHYCIERGIVNKSIVDRKCFKTRQREQCAKMLIQDIFKKGYDARNEFLHILEAFDQTPSVIQQTSKVADHVHANEKVTLPGLKFQGTYCLAASEETEPPKEHDEDRKEDAESGYHSLNSNRRSQALSELESSKESNEEQTPKSDDVAEGGTMTFDHDAEEHSLIKDESRAHLKQHPALMSRPMAVPRRLPMVYFDHGIYDSNTRPRRSQSMLGRVAEDVTEVSVKPSGEISLSFNSNRHSDCSRHSLKITDLSENFN